MLMNESTKSAGLNTRKLRKQGTKIIELLKELMGVVMGGSEIFQKYRNRYKLNGFSDSIS